MGEAYRYLHWGWESLKSECLAGVYKLLESCNEDEKNDLNQIKEEIQKQEFNESNLVKDVAKLLELRDIIWKVWTIHSFCNEMLRKLNYFAYLWYSKGPVIIDDYKLSQIIESLWYDKRLKWMVWMVINKDDWDLSKFNEEEVYFTGEAYECTWKVINELFPTLGNPTKPTSARSFNSINTFLSSPGSPSSLV